MKKHSLKKCRLKLLNYSLEIFQFGFQIHNSPPCIKQVSERKWGIHFLYFLCLKQISIGKMDIYIFVYLMYIKQLLNSFFEINLSHLIGELMDKQSKTNINRVSQKNVWFAAPGAKRTSFVQLSRLQYGVFIFWKFFSIPMAQKFRKRKICIWIVSVKI